MTDVCVVGAGGVLGQALVKRLVAAGHHVVGVVRSHAQTAALEALGATARVADASDASALAAAWGTPVGLVYSLVRGQDATGARTDARCNEQIVKAAHDTQARRLVLVSSVGVGNSQGALPPPARVAMAAALEAKLQSERIVRASDLSWTIVRPGRLVDGPSSDTARLVHDPSLNGPISREDLATLLVQCGFDPAAAGKTFTALG